MPEALVEPASNGQSTSSGPVLSGPAPALSGSFDLRFVLGSGLIGATLGGAGGGPPLLALGLLVALAAALASARLASSALPYLSWLLAGILGLDLLLGTPSAARVFCSLILWSASLLALGWASRLEPAPPTHGRHDVFAVLVLMAYAGLAWAAITLMYAHVGDRFLSQDTAYFEQGFWGYVEGRSFFMGSSQAWWVYDPPLQSHFAMHFSPVLLLVAELYRLWPSYHLLHLLQILALTASAWPLYLLWRSTDVRAALLLMLAYLLHPALISQTQLSFHELALAAPAVSFAAYFFVRGWRWPFLLCLILGILAREDLALLALMGGFAALLRRGTLGARLSWTLPAWGIGVIGWVGSGLLMHSFGASGGQVILSLFSGFGSSLGEILTNMLLRPLDVLDLMLEGHRKRYVLGLLGPGLLGALLSPVALFVVPALVINLLVRGAGTAWLTVHYSVYLTAPLMVASQQGWSKLEELLARRLRAPAHTVRTGLALLMVGGALLGMPDFLTAEQLESYRPRGDGLELREAVQHIPDQVAVAVPRHAAFLLARRERLYLVNRWASYTLYDPELILLEKDLELATSRLHDGTSESYARYARVLAASARYEIVWEGRHHLLYRDKQHREASLAPGGDRRPGVPQELLEAVKRGPEGGEGTHP